MQINEIESRINDLKKNIPEFGWLNQVKRIDAVMADYENQYITVLFCGEFKRGKSSLLNSILEVDLLPVDIVPTTATIHTIRYGNSLLKRHFTDGRVEESVLNAEETLKTATKDAGGNIKETDVEYVEVFLEKQMLKNKLVLIDTPGTNDLSETRSEIVYRMIPRAMAVCFVIDATTQLTQSESTFLLEKLVKLNVPKLCFVVNKLDRVPVEERSEVLGCVEEQLKKILPNIQLTIITSSARDKEIGVGALIKFVTETGTVGLNKDVLQKRLFASLRSCLYSLEAEADFRLNALQDDQKEIERKIGELRAAKNEFEEKWEKFRIYLSKNGFQTLEVQLKESIHYASRDLIRKLEVMIKVANNPAVIVNHQFPYMLENSLKIWLETRVPQLMEFIRRYEKAMLNEFWANFKQQINLAMREQFLRARLQQTNLNNDSSSKVMGIEETENIVQRYGLPAIMGMTGLAFGGVGAIAGTLVGNLISQITIKNKMELARKNAEAAFSAVTVTEFQKFQNLVLKEFEDYFSQFESNLKDVIDTRLLEKEKSLMELLENVNDEKKVLEKRVLLDLISKIKSFNEMLI